MNKEKKLILNISNLLLGSSANGPGVRDVIWLQGCTVGCKGCFNQQLWPHQPKYLIPVGQLAEKFKLRIPFIEGITASGGEPTEQAHALAPLFEMVREFGLSTFLFSGYTYKSLKKRDDPHITRLLAATDILVDAPFRIRKKSDNLLWRGSSNQKIHFLTGRYDADFLNAPIQQTEQEIHIHKERAGGASIIRTGFLKD